MNQPAPHPPTDPLKVFLAVLAAIAVGVFLFAPERLPSGIGLKPLPMKVTKRTSLVTFGRGWVAVIENQAPVTLHNVNLTCTDVTGKNKVIFKETWPPNETFEIGAFEGWVFESGETLKIEVSGYLPYQANF